MSIARLGVNIDHVATLRQARGEFYPKITRACIDVISAGADQITIHLREDRRHIQDQDVHDVSAICKEHSVPLNLEMGANQEILSLGLDLKVDWICFVPENRQERTTEGGLNLLDDYNFKKLKNSVQKCKDQGVKVSLFVESNIATLEKCAELEVEAVEIHTGEYAKKYLENENFDKYLKSFENSYQFLKNENINFHAGHGLTDKSLTPLLEQKLFREYNIGHWIISEAIFQGLGNVVKEMSHQIKKYPIKE